MPKGHEFSAYWPVSFGFEVDIPVTVHNYGEMKTVEKHGGFVFQHHFDVTDAQRDIFV